MDGTRLGARLALRIGAPVVAVLLSVSPAAASTVAVRGTGPAFLDVLGGSEANGFEVSKGDGIGLPTSSYRVRDRIPNTNTYNQIAPGAGCDADPAYPVGTAVKCAPGEDIKINAETGAGNDFVLVNAGVAASPNVTLNVHAFLGPGDDEFLDLDNAVADRVFADQLNAADDPATGGDDAVSTRGGDDAIFGGPGGDRHLRILQSNGDAGLNGGDGNDIVNAGPGDDLVDAGPGDDRQPSGFLDPRVTGGPGDDDVTGGAGSDVVGGGDGDDRLESGTWGRCASGAGSDVYFGDHAALSPGGNDTLFATDGCSPNPLSPDVFHGGPGVDTVDYSGRNRAAGDNVVASLDGAANDGVEGEGDNVGPSGDVENLTSTKSGTDSLIGNDGPNALTAGQFSRATLIGLGGDDVLTGGWEPTTMTAGEGNDRLIGGLAGDAGDGGPGMDVLELGFGADLALADDGGTADAVNCGGVTADDGLDTAFLDAADVETGCEKISRAATSTAGQSPAPSVPLVVALGDSTLPTLDGADRMGAVFVTTTGLFTLGSFTVSCPVPNGSDCVGSATVTSARPVASARARRVVLARGAFRIPAGAKRKAQARLTPAGRRILKRRGRIKAKATIAVTDRAAKRYSKTVTLTLRLRKRRR